MSPLNEALTETDPAERVCKLTDYLHGILRECRDGFTPSQAQIQQAEYELGRAMEDWRDSRRRLSVMRETGLIGRVGAA